MPGIRGRAVRGAIGLTLVVNLIACAADDGRVATKDAEIVPIVGVKIYRHEGDVSELFARWLELGVNTAFVGEELARRSDFRGRAEEAGIQLFLIFPVFYAPEKLSIDPNLYAVTDNGRPAVEDWVEFACPTDPEFQRLRVREAVELVRDVRPAALSLDFIRYFVFWELVGPGREPASLPDTCYCPRCLERFRDEIGLDMPTGDPVLAAGWVRANVAEEWTAFKCKTIVSLVRDISKAVRAVDADILINIHAVPWREDDFNRAITRIAGQDHAALGEHADWLSPMCYSFMQHRQPKWISAVVEDLDRQASCPILPSIQVAPAYRKGEDFSADEFEEALSEALRPPSAGVVFWSWEALAGDSEKADVVARVIRGQENRARFTGQR